MKHPPEKEGISSFVLMMLPLNMKGALVEGFI